MEYTDKYDQLLKLITEEVEIDGKKYLLKEEVEKFFVKGNKTAATRVRKFMQELKKKAQEIRDDVQDYRQTL